jgi:hypothetical protein
LLRRFDVLCYRRIRKSLEQLSFPAYWITRCPGKGRHPVGTSNGHGVTRLASLVLGGIKAACASRSDFVPIPAHPHSVWLPNVSLSYAGLPAPVASFLFSCSVRVLGQHYTEFRARFDVDKDLNDSLLYTQAIPAPHSTSVYTVLQRWHADYHAAHSLVKSPNRAFMRLDKALEGRTDAAC